VRRDKQLLGVERPRAIIYPRPPAAATPGPPPPFTRPALRRYLGGVREVASDHRRLHYHQLLRQLAGLALRHPGLVPLLLGTAWRFRARDWYRRAPFLPLPPSDYVEWRLHTAYGDGAAAPPAADLARYLRWTARMRKQDRP
jgi:hypothetical protein